MRNLFQQVFRKSSAALLLVALASILAVGCGNSENFVFTNTVNQPGATTGNLTFNFVQAQGVITVPIGTTTLEFTFFDGPNQTGNVTLTDEQPYAAQVTVFGVPVATQSYRIVARNANGAALATTTGAVTVVPGQTVTVDVTGAITVLTQPNNSPLNVYVSNNGAGNAGDLDFFSQLFSFVRTFTSGNNQGIALDNVGAGYHAGDTTVNVLSTLADRTGAFDNTLDRVMNIDDSVNINFGGSQILVTGLASSGSSTFDFTTPAAPWDITGDIPADRAFVAFTDGTIGVYDNVSTLATGTPTRTFTATGLDNAHGIAYDSATDILVVSDVGDPGVADDGEIYVFSNASTATGTVEPKALISGSNTLLGNPVDIDLANGDLRVAEKSQDQLLIFANILQSTGGNLAPAVAVAETKPESLASQPPLVYGPDNSDIDGGVTVQGLVVSTNPAMGNALIVRMTTSLDNLNPFDTELTDAESARVDGRGDVYLTRDGTIQVLGQLGRTIRDSFDINNFNDRSGGTLNSGKGLDVVESRGLLMVANNGNGTVGIFGKHSDFSNPVATMSLAAATDGGPTWDLDYDPTNDRLFVTKGASVLVYDNYLAGDPATATPDREISVNNGVFLHGIVYDAVNDALLLSDVGSGMVTDDGQIFVVENASTADGDVTADVRITNSATNMLGNPVDVAYDGTNLYVAEKSNNLVVRFDNIRSATSGAIDFDDSVTVTAPESISLVTGL